MMATTSLLYYTLRCTRSYNSAHSVLKKASLLGSRRYLQTCNATFPLNAVHVLARRHARISQPRSPSTSHRPYSTSSSSNTLTSSSSRTPSLTHLYSGPLTNTYRTLKLFSLSSFALATSLTPFMFLIESSLPTSARWALAVTAVTTSGVSTGLVGWAGGGYVVGIEGVREAGAGTPGAAGTGEEKAKENAFDAIRIETRSLLLQPRYTIVYDPAFLGQTNRPLAKWELVDRVESVSGPGAGSSEEAREETVAETTDKHGKVLGRWVVRWSKEGDGKTVGVCRGAGKVQRYFQVHEELLPPFLRSIA